MLNFDKTRHKYYGETWHTRMERSKNEITIHKTALQQVPSYHLGPPIPTFQLKPFLRAYWNAFMHNKVDDRVNAQPTIVWWMQWLYEITCSLLWDVNLVAMVSKRKIDILICNFGNIKYWKFKAKPILNISFILNGTLTIILNCNIKQHCVGYNNRGVILWIGILSCFYIYIIEYLLKHAKKLS